MPNTPYEREKSIRLIYRVLLLIIVILSLTNCAGWFGFAYSFTMKKEKEIVLVAIDDVDKKIVTLERDKDITLEQSELLREATISRYVIDRFTINHIDEEDRYNNVKLMSSDAVFAEFKEQLDPSINPNSPLNDQNLLIDIEVDRAYPIVSSNVYRVEFIKTTRKKSTVKGKIDLVSREAWVALVQYEYKENNQTQYKDRLLNIGGITITQFKVTR